MKARALEDSQALTRAKVAERREAKLARREAKLELRARRRAEVLEREALRRVQAAGKGGGGVKAVFDLYLGELLREDRKS